MASLTYRSAGLDLDLYDQAMKRLPALMQRTHSARVMPLADGFAGLFRLNHGDASRRSYDDPVLVSGTDGVGTKLKVAQRLGRFNTVGIDLVAMCVNDCLCLGAEPLFFLDYLAIAKDDPDLVSQLVEGVAAGCLQAKSALLGGETAVMPDVYAPGDFDMAGFSVGVAERSQLIDGATIQPGDVVLGLASSGFHSNGYSLIRKCVFEHAPQDLAAPVPGTETAIGDALLEPTRIYVDVVHAALKVATPREEITGLAHITGGGLRDNLERILPATCRLSLSRTAWSLPPIFPWLQQLGNIDREEMFRVFNMGIGFVIIARPDAVARIEQAVETAGIACYRLGEAVAGSERGVDFLN